MPIIEAYRFGEMIVDGQVYDRDLIITPDAVIPNWWRETGHSLALHDLLAVLETFKPNVLVVGTGKFGMLKIAASVQNGIEALQIEIFAARTNNAVKRFNAISSSRKTIGAFHLTC